jgi:hypothetical protein
MIKGDQIMKFQKDLFQYHGGYLTYGPKNKFIARFKHRGPVGKADFVRLLTKYYTTEMYFSSLENNLAPLQILMNDGFVKFDYENRRFLVSK